MSVARTPDALVLDVESCNQLVGCPGCGLNHTRSRARGGGGDRRALGRGPGADPMAQTPMDMPRNWPGLVLWTGCFEGCWLLLVVLRPLACVLVG